MGDRGRRIVCVRIVCTALLALVAPALARADFQQLARCQSKIAGAGVAYARTALRATLKCTNKVNSCRIQCEQGLFGPDCDPDDPDSAPAYRTCLDRADAVCQSQAVRIARAEVRKRTRIIGACDDVTVDELCGADTQGLYFKHLNAGCRELDPAYECNLVNLVDCVGGPLEQALVGRIGGLLDARAGESLALLGLAPQFPGVPITRKTSGQALGAAVDLFSVAGSAGEDLVVTLETGDDGGGVSTLRAQLGFLNPDAATPVVNTTVSEVPCPVPSACGATCQQFRRTLPSTGTFFISVASVPTGACTGGSYRLTVTSPSGLVPTSPSGAFLESGAALVD